MGRKGNKSRKKSSNNDTEKAEPNASAPSVDTAPGLSESAAASSQETKPVPESGSANAETGGYPTSTATMSLETAEELKRQGNEFYVKDDPAAALEKYALAIEAFEASTGDSPQALEHRKALAVLYSNRAQAALALVRREHAAGNLKPGALSSLPKELRLHGFRANADASQAVELDPQNAKAWLRRGQALLVMSVMQQRAKEAVECFKKAQACGLPASLQKEVEQNRKYAQHLFDQETPMPEGMCAIQ